MLKLLLACFKNRRINLFIIVGIILFLFPDKISETAPYIVGIALIVHAALNAFIVFRSPESDISLGGAVVSGVTGIILLLETEQAIAILGIVWAVFSLTGVAKEIDDYRKSGRFRIIGAIGIVLTIVFSALLMLDPFEHFAFHVRILGLEMIAGTLIHRRSED